ncbi:hypothetical protein GYA28_02730 [Candidatus Roizmanbacteria bacterium]|jgi:TRAP-type C4-dicarboxylate transport system permease small subunit|nr:hypothetical protein [Candidatus Roizmanbacteria bacterium]
MENRYLAQTVNMNGQQITGPLQGINNLGDIVNKMTMFLLPLAGIILLFVLIWGGYDYMMSQGKPDKIKSAQAKITTGLIGFILLILAFFLTKLLTTIFGLSGWSPF